MAGTKTIRTKDGETLRVGFERKGADELKVTAYDRHDEPVAWVDVELWKQRGHAKIDVSLVKNRYRKRGIGQALYPLINRETKAMWRLPLSSDYDGDRSDGAEALWKKLETLGLAHRAEDRYVMEAYVPSLLEYFGVIGG